MGSAGGSLVHSRHARVHQVEGAYFLEILGAQQYTFVNEMPYRVIQTAWQQHTPDRIHLAEGDTLRFGGSVQGQLPRNVDSTVWTDFRSQSEHIIDVRVKPTKL